MSDGLTGGRALTRRLAGAFPRALLLGLAVGMAPAVARDDWRIAPAVAGVLVALVGGVLAALEDERVQRRVDRSRRRPGGNVARD